MKKQIFLFSALAAVLVSGCAVAGKNADSTNEQIVISTEINSNTDENTDENTADNSDENADENIEANVDANTDGTTNENAAGQTENSTEQTGNADEQTGNTDDAADSEAGFNAFGHYADMQGTDEIYSDIWISELSDGSIAVEIGIFRLTTLRGVGYTTDDANVINFVSDSEDVIKGTIECSENGAVFTVTESEWSLLSVGETVECTTVVED